MSVIGAWGRRMLVLDVVLVVLLSAVACAHAAGEAAPPSATPVAGSRPSDEAVAFFYGRQYALACLFTLVGQNTYAGEYLKPAQIAAKTLGVSEPALPPHGREVEMMRDENRRQELLLRKGPTVRAAFALGIDLTSGWFSAALESGGANAEGNLAAIEDDLADSRVPPEVWRESIAALRARPTMANYNALTDALEKYYRS
jgi:hypothetical protein